MKVRSLLSVCVNNWLWEEEIRSIRRKHLGLTLNAYTSIDYHSSFVVRFTSRFVSLSLSYVVLHCCSFSLGFSNPLSNTLMKLIPCKFIMRRITWECCWTHSPSSQPQLGANRLTDAALLTSLPFSLMRSQHPHNKKHFCNNFFHFYLSAQGTYAGY